MVNSGASIGDKIAASKRKGLWVGGVVPLGYQAKDCKITVVENEAKTVRHIFRRYLELGSINPLLADLRASGIRTKRRSLSNGRVIGDIGFGRGALAHLLRNRFYIGEVRYKGELLRGEQPAILDRKIFDTVQAKLDEQRNGTLSARTSSDAVLMGRIFDDRGNRMTPTSKLKKGVRYRYYISTVLNQGQAKKAGSMARVPADLVERLIVEAVRRHLGSPNRSSERKARTDFVNSAALQSSKAMLSGSRFIRPFSRLRSSARTLNRRRIDNTMPPASRQHSPFPGASRRPKLHVRSFHQLTPRDERTSGRSAPRQEPNSSKPSPGADDGLMNS